MTSDFLADIAFEKWEGLGNDFLLVRAPFTPPLSWVRATCDRRRGVGADGVLVADAGSSPSMVVFNADGSRPEMCGNGLRCVAAHLAASHAAPAAELEIATDAGPRRCRVLARGAHAYEVEVEMGPATLGELLSHEHRGRRLEFTTVDVGNPHAVLFEELGAPSTRPGLRAELESFGPKVERIPAGGTNVEIARVDPDTRRIEVDVWERGVGRTDACGTGACAVAAAACALGLVPYEEEIAVRLPGGELTIRVEREGRRVRMRGPARRVFAGRVPG